MRKSLIVLATVAMSGCATLEPEPCTSEWVEWKTSQLTDSFSAQYRAELRDMRQFARKLENPSPFVLLEAAGYLEDFRTIATDFSGEIMPQLRGAIDQCGAPTEFAAAFSGFLQQQGMPASIVTWVEDIAATMDALSTDG